MTEIKPLTDEEIIEILPRLRAVSIKCAIILAEEHSLSFVELKKDGEWFSRCPTNHYRLLSHRDLYDQAKPWEEERVTIHPPPKRRPIKRDELPEGFIQWRYGADGDTQIRAYIGGFFFDTLHPLTGGPEWREVGTRRWHPFWIEEPQPPLVITTENLAPVVGTE